MSNERILVGAFIGFVLGVFGGLALYGGDVFAPMVPALLGPLLGAGVVIAMAHRRDARPLDPERERRRLAAHRAMAELEPDGRR